MIRLRAALRAADVEGGRLHQGPAGYAGRYLHGVEVSQ